MVLQRKYFLSIILLLFLFIILFIPLYFTSLVLYPNINCTKEHHVYCDTPSELNLPYEQIKVINSDGFSLESWYIPSQNSKKSIIFVHGHGGTKNEGLRFARTLNAAGFNLLALSLRRNANTFASMGFHEIKDVKAAVDFLLTEKKQDSVGVFGFSMGAATSILAMEEDPRIKAGIFSSGYSTAIDALTEAAKRDYSLPYFPIILMAKILINFRGNMDIESVRPIDKISKISPRPIFIFHCDKDHYVDSKHAILLFEAAKEPKQKWIPKCDRHELIWNTHREESETKARDFFIQNL